jgi:hypothetical protein
MKETERNKNIEGGPSWADETLSLGLRKELLARELQKLADRKPKAAPQSSASQPGLTGRKAEGRTRERPR